MGFFDQLDHLRDYQQEATVAVEKEFEAERSTMLIMPTGTGKTQTFLTVAGRFVSRHQTKALIIGHRQELIYQPFNRWKDMTGEYCEMEMGPHRRSFRSKVPIICASKDSLHPERLKEAFPDPKEIGLLVFDEAHRCVRKNASYRYIIDYFMDGNPECRMLGPTATPDRADEEAMGTTFKTVAYDYPLFDPDGGPAAINDGWLVQLRQEIAHVDDVRMDLIGTDGGGDLQIGKLELEMIGERPLHRITGAANLLCYQEKSLVFTAGRDHASRVAEILNREKAGSAFALISGAKDAPGWVVDAGDEDQRRKLLRAYARGEFPYLVNMGVLVEGYDDPSIMNLLMGRPTKSRALYAQMVGRGTRILPNTIEGRDAEGQRWCLDRDDRLAAIADSEKPFCRVIEFAFTGNTRHALIGCIDILGGKVSDDVVELAKKNVAKKGAGHVIDELKRAAAEKAAEHRAAIRAQVQVQTESTNALFDPLAVVSSRNDREPGWVKGKQPTENMKAALRRFGLKPFEIRRMSYHNAGRLIGELKKRSVEGKATYRQCIVLTKNGKDINVSKNEASAIIEGIFKSNGHAGARAPERTEDQHVEELYRGDQD